ncbi:MAG: hypothetical protein NVSMB48_10010 [Marmoricola sp.]
MTVEWQAQWISPTATGERPGFRPAYRLRGEVTLDRPVRRATLHATTHDIYELELDGARVTTDALTPGFTEYAYRVQVQSYDVTDLLGQGAHLLDAVLADGWYRGQVGITRATDQWGTRTAFLAQVEVEHVDGSRSVFGTDDTWRWSTTHIHAADLIEGQREDRRLVGVHDWHRVEVSDRGYDSLVTSPAPPVRAVEELRPVSVVELRSGVHVVDLGQNINGRVRLADLGPEGTEVTLTHGEALGPDGDVTMTHLQPAMPFLPEPLSAGQVDTVVSAGVDGDAFEPRLTTHGFQCVRVEGHPGPLTADDVTDVVVHTDLAPRGSFGCDVEIVNRLHDAAVWRFRGNACDISTDCPTRERAGWTGDWQLYVPTASYLYDVRGFSLKWLRDLIVTQWPDGNLGNMAPIPVAEKSCFLEKMNGFAGWGDAVVRVPWELYEEYADTATLAKVWPAMVRWLDRVERMASQVRHPGSGRQSPGAAAARAAPLGRRLPLGRVARAWGAGRLPILHRRRQGGGPRRSTPGRPATPPASQRSWGQRAAYDLAALVREAGTHLQTGFLSTPDLLQPSPTHLDLAYELLLQDSEPSWMTMIERGATTVWERWDGFAARGAVRPLSTRAWLTEARYPRRVPPRLSSRRIVAGSRSSRRAISPTRDRHAPRQRSPPAPAMTDTGRPDR